MKIPLYIINMNRYDSLERLIKKVKNCKYVKIIIIDNNSTFPPLLDYYKSIKYKIIRLDKNYGTRVFWTANIVHSCRSNWFILTDSDILPKKSLTNESIIELFHIYNKLINKGCFKFSYNFIRYITYYSLKNNPFSLLQSYYSYIKFLYYRITNKRIVKIGMALNISDIPDYNPYKKDIISWEKQFWKIKLDDKCYLSQIATTFALYYKPDSKKFKTGPAIRVAGDFLAYHLPWYDDPDKLSDNDKYYLQFSDSETAHWTSKARKDFLKKNF